MSEVSGRGVVGWMRRVLPELPDPDGYNALEIELPDLSALLSYIDALEEVVEETKRKIAIDFVCYDPIGSQGAIGYRDDDECRLCEWQFICQALAKLREMDKPLPTFDDVKGILADGEEDG